MEDCVYLDVAGFGQMSRPFADATCQRGVTHKITSEHRLFSRTLENGRESNVRSTLNYNHRKMPLLGDINTKKHLEMHRFLTLPCPSLTQPRYLQLLSH